MCIYQQLDHAFVCLTDTTLIYPIPLVYTCLHALDEDHACAVRSRLLGLLVSLRFCPISQTLGLSLGRFGIIASSSSFGVLV